MSSYSHFFSKKFQHICVSLDVNFNESLTNDVVSFEQLGPGCFFWLKKMLYLELYMSPLYYHSAVSNDCNRKRKALIRLPESVIKIYEHADCTSLPAFSVHWYILKYVTANLKNVQADLGLHCPLKENGCTFRGSNCVKLGLFCLFVLCWGFTAQSTQWGHVERGQFTYEGC